MVVVALLAMAATVTSSSIMLSPAAPLRINSVHMADTISTSCIDLCSCPSYCWWAPCSTVLEMSLAAGTRKMAIEQVAACAGCHHESLCDNPWNVSLNDWCNYEVSAPAASLHTNVTLAKCSRLYQNELLVGISVFLMVAMVVGVVSYYRNSRRARATRVTVIPAPQRYEPEDGCAPDEPPVPSVTSVTSPLTRENDSV